MTPQQMPRRSWASFLYLLERDGRACQSAYAGAMARHAKSIDARFAGGQVEGSIAAVTTLTRGETIFLSAFNAWGF